MVLIFYTPYINVNLALHEILRSKVSKGGISKKISCVCPLLHVYFCDLTSITPYIQTSFVSEELFLRSTYF